jgi:hypothetical protein
MGSARFAKALSIVDSQGSGKWSTWDFMEYGVDFEAIIQRQSPIAGLKVKGTVWTRPELVA